MSGRLTVIALFAAIALVVLVAIAGAIVAGDVSLKESVATPTPAASPVIDSR
jgi:hypothetical protein